MSTLFNKLFQKSPTPSVQFVEETHKDSFDLLKHFYTKGHSSEKLDALKKKIDTITFSSNKKEYQYQVAKSYLEIEIYLITEDAHCKETSKDLREELRNLYNEVSISPPFNVLYSKGNVQEIELALLLTDFLYDNTSNQCGYVSILAPEFTVYKEVNLTKITSNMVYYLACQREIKKYIQKLSKEIQSSCSSKNIVSPQIEWCTTFLNIYESLETSGKIDSYFPSQEIEENPAKLEEVYHTSTPILIKEQPTIVTQQQRTSTYEAVLENMLDQAIIFDRSGNLLFANDKARRFFNFEKQATSSISIYNLLPKKIGAFLRADIEDIEHTRPNIFLGKRKDIDIKNKDKTEEHFEITTTNNYTEGEDTYSIFIKDITNRKDRFNNINKEMKHVQRAAKAKSTFLSNMSHEIRTPLNVILGLADIVKKSNNQDETLFKKNIDVIHFSARNLLSIVNDILDFSKIEAGKLSIQSYDFNLKKVITSLTEGFKTKSNEKGVYLYTEIDENIPDIVVGDQYRLNQILTNLIGNAIKFTNEGEIRVIVTCNNATEDVKKIHFEVKDTGIGIPEDNLDTIFNSFYQVENTKNTKSKGTGLGLAITKELIHLQQGELTATSVEGEGSSFKFILPFVKSKLHRINETKDLAITRNDKQLEGLRVLVAEDNAMNQFYIKQLLNRLHIEVDIAENGKEAIELYNSKDDSYYNLILMDMHMPILGGVEAIKKIRESKKGTSKRVPIVICSADVFPESRKEAIKAGIDFYLTKPVDEDALKEVLFWLVSDDQQNLELNISENDTSLRSSVAINKLNETFDNDEEFIITLLEVFIQETPDDYKNLRNCVEKEFYSKAAELAHKMKSSFMNLGMTHQGHFLQQIEKHISTEESEELGKKYFKQFKNIYTKTLLDVNILLIELKRK